MMIREKWKEASSLSLLEAAFLMLGIDPDHHAEDAYFKPESLEHFNNHQMGDRVGEKMRTLFGAAKDKLIEIAPSSLPIDEIANAPSIRILTSSYVKWLSDEVEYPDIVAAFSYEHRSTAPNDSSNDTNITKHHLATRTNILDPAIKKAIAQAGNRDTAEVFLKLKELALNGEPPFTGAFDQGALMYTNAMNRPMKLTKDALTKRLNRRSAKGR